MRNGIALSDAPDWKSLRAEVPEVASKRIGKMLAGLDRAEKQVFALRGMCALLIEERKLYRFVVDEEVGDYYQSFDKYLKDICPESWSYVRQALRAVKELKEVPFEDLLQINRCNITQLCAVSDRVRALPEVIEAAKTLPEKKLVEKLNTEHSQHLECRQPVVMAPAGDASEEKRAVEIAMALEHCTTEAEARKAIYVEYIVDHEQEYESLKDQEQTA
jgi:hypothetical protein